MQVFLLARFSARRTTTATAQNNPNPRRFTNLAQTLLPTVQTQSALNPV
jgi:hypothetical protein